MYGSHLEGAALYRSCKSTRPSLFPAESASSSDAKGEQNRAKRDVGQVRCSWICLATSKQVGPYDPREREAASLAGVLSRCPACTNDKQLPGGTTWE